MSPRCVCRYCGVDLPPGADALYAHLEECPKLPSKRREGLRLAEEVPAEERVAALAGQSHLGLIAVAAAPAVPGILTSIAGMPAPMRDEA